MSQKKMWTLMVQLSMNQWDKAYHELYFDDEMWDWILEEAPKYGFNQILLEVGDGIQYQSHPEISLQNAWSHRRVHKELARCREKGITVVLITHHMDEAAKADRVVVLHKGKVAADGTPQEVFSQVELLHSIGLAAPESVELCWELNKEGFDLPLDKLDPEKCAQTLRDWLMEN